MAYMHRSSDTGDLSLGPTDVGVDVGGLGGGGRASVGAGSDVDIDAVLPHRRGNVHAASHLQCAKQLTPSIDRSSLVPGTFNPISTSPAAVIQILACLAYCACTFVLPRTLASFEPVS